jgi:hypothetical protein
MQGRSSVNDTTGSNCTAATAAAANDMSLAAPVCKQELNGNMAASTSANASHHSLLLLPLILLLLLLQVCHGPHPGTWRN